MCVMSAYLSLSPLLHFVPKFSIQKIKGGERRVSEREKTRRKRGGESAIMDFISNSLPISRTPKRDTVSKKRTFLNSDRRRGRRIIYRIWTHTRTHTVATLHATLYSTFHAPEQP